MCSCQRSALGPSLLLLQLGNNLPATGLEEEWNQWGSALEGVQMSQSGDTFSPSVTSRNWENIDLMVTELWRRAV
ncbi:unnamed protein product [Gadus morhua 'NCC']